MYAYCDPRPAHLPKARGDCGVRALAIAHYMACRGMSPDTAYMSAREWLAAFIEKERGWKETPRRRGGIKRGGRRYSGLDHEGIFKPTYAKALKELGWTWVACSTVGKPSKVKPCREHLPAGPVILRLSRHFAAAIDGLVTDSYDPCREGTRMVYGYWVPPEKVQ